MPEVSKTTKVKCHLLTNRVIYLAEKITIFIVPDRNYKLLYQSYMISTCIVPARNYKKRSWDIDFGTSKDLKKNKQIWEILLRFI